MADSQSSGTDVIVLVCIECGRKYHFEGESQVPEELTCEKCGNEVFRRFQDSTQPGEAEEEFEDRTARDLDTDDPEGDAAPGDLRDLNNP